MHGYQAESCPKHQAEGNLVDVKQQGTTSYDRLPAVSPKNGKYL